MNKPQAPVAMVRCPQCGTKQPMRQPDSIYYCDRCRGQFDDCPDEGGSYHADPSKRMELEEARRERRRGQR